MINRVFTYDIIERQGNLHRITERATTLRFASSDINYPPRQLVVACFAYISSAAAGAC